jgi:omega-6 fatty acid desaturase (delta-12 desaturase)
MSTESAHAHDAQPTESEIVKWKKIVADFEKPSAKRANWQIISTLAAYFACWVAMHYAMKVSMWWTVPFVIIAGGMLVRVFIIFHDCTHNSFYKSQKANRWVGYFMGLLVFTPFKQWRWEHSIHHATAGDLDRRGVGDVPTLTIEEYLKLPKRDRIVYRCVRNPIILFILAPLYLFVLRERIPVAKASPETKRAVWHTNIGIVVMLTIGSLIFGPGPYFLLQFASMGIAATVGVWLFYVQHQFEGTYWERHEHWEYTAAALEGSSYYKLPRLLQYFSGNIGFHHIHHLSSKIPNYHLERCHYSHPAFQEIKPMTIMNSLKSLSYRVWDEGQKNLVGWKRMREVRREMEESGMLNNAEG